MKNSSAILIGIFLLFEASILLAQSASGPVTFERVRLPGSLEPTTKLGCIGSDQIEPSYTPPDLYLAFVECANTDNFGKAARLVSIAEMFGRFDVARVADLTARGGPQVLASRAISQIPRTKLQTLLPFLKVSIVDVTENEQLCRDLLRLGPPAYDPTYLVKHGLAAHLDKPSPDGPLVKGFDPKATWAQLLKSSLKCVP